MKMLLGSTWRGGWITGSYCTEYSRRLVSGEVGGCYGSFIAGGVEYGGGMICGGGIVGEED